LEVGDACRTQPALGQLPCYPSRVLGRPKIKDVARV
jgi:hypothetical protein